MRSFGAPALRISSREYSRRSKDLVTAGSRWLPAGVSSSWCGRRSKSCTPMRLSSAITWRESALCEVCKALAAAVKLPWRATASKARRAFNGSQRRSIRTLDMEPHRTWGCLSSPRTRGVCQCLFWMPGCCKNASALCHLSIASCEQALCLCNICSSILRAPPKWVIFLPGTSVFAVLMVFFACRNGGTVVSLGQA